MKTKLFKPILVVATMAFSFFSCTETIDVEPLDNNLENSDFKSTVNGSFNVLTYNIAGLWDPISQSNPSVNTIKISPKLNPYNIVCVQEDFDYHSDLVTHVTHPYHSNHSGGSTSGDGLNRLSIFPFTAHKRITWNDCYGTFNNGNDCLASKGFSFEGMRLHQV